MRPSMKRSLPEPERDYALIAPLRTCWAQAGSLTTGDSNPFKTQRTFQAPQQLSVTINTNVGSLTAANIIEGDVYCQATVTWTINGVSIQRTVDLVSSVTLTGVADAVAVSVQDVTAAAEGDVENDTYDVSVLMAINTRPVSPVPLIQSDLEGISGLATNAFRTYTVPVGATGVAVFASTFGGSAVNMRLQEETLDGSVVLLDTNVVNGAYVPLLSGAQQVVITNLGSFVRACAVFSMDG